MEWKLWKKIINDDLISIMFCNCAVICCIISWRWNCFKWFWQRIKQYFFGVQSKIFSIHRIVLINEPFLSYYPSSYPYTSRHYVVVSECIESNSGDTVTFTIDDPNHWNNGTLCAKHVVSASNLYSCFAALEWIVYN